jgi:hypothetical protein
VLLHLLRKHGFHTPLADEESFVSAITIFLFFNSKSDLMIGADKKQDSSVAVVSINLLGIISFEPPNRCESLPQNDCKELQPPLPTSFTDVVYTDPGASGSVAMRSRPPSSATPTKRSSQVSSQLWAYAKVQVDSKSWFFRMPNKLRHDGELWTGSSEVSAFK